MNIKEVVDKALTAESVPSDAATLDISAGLTACADPELLARALQNLVRNAIRHNDKVGKIIITGAKSGGEVAISVADCGTGVPRGGVAENLRRLLPPSIPRARGRPGGVGWASRSLKHALSRATAA